MSRYISTILIGCMLLSGCSYMPKFLSRKKPVMSEPVNTVQITKRTAIQAAQEYLNSNGFEDKFITAKARKLKKRISVGDEPLWVWEVYFSSNEYPFWKFWRKSPIMVEVNAETAEIERWGRR